MTSSLPTPSSPTSPASFLPPDDPQRRALHNEVHARPPARVRLPALIVQVAVLNAGITRDDECAHLRRLSGQADLPLERLSGGYSYTENEAGENIRSIAQVAEGDIIHVRVADGQIHANVMKVTGES